jgi:aspartyl aminopeptidase
VGLKQLGVEVYGGALLNSWLDLDLTLAGRVMLTSGESLLFHHRSPLLRVPQLAIHLDREVVTEGLKLNPQQHLTPVWGIGDPTPGGFRTWLAGELGCSTSDIADFDVACADTRPATVLGADRELLSAPRLDNLCCSWGAVTALVGHATDQPAIVVLNDHEEVGSTSSTGAQGAWVASTLERLAIARGFDRAGFLALLERSLMASADMAHATHPNYPERHEPSHHVFLGQGPVVKHNVNMRYSTSSEGAAAFRAACTQASCGFQEYSHRGDLPCGSTIGPVTAAKLGLEVVDVGMPQLSMHSARELMACADVPKMLDAFTAWLGPTATFDG